MVEILLMQTTHTQKKRVCRDFEIKHLGEYQDFAC